MTMKGHKIPPRSHVPRNSVLELKRATMVARGLLPPELTRVLLARGWLSEPQGPEGPLHLLANGWAAIASSDQAVHNRRSYAAVKAHGADPVQVAQNARARRARWRMKHMPLPFSAWLEETLDKLATPSAHECDRDALPITGGDLTTLRALGEHGLLCMYDEDCVLCGPCDALGAVQPAQRRYARKAWSLVRRGLVRATHAGSGGGALSIILEPTASGAQVLAAAFTV